MSLLNRLQNFTPLEDEQIFGIANIIRSEHESDLVELTSEATSVESATSVAVGYKNLTVQRKFFIDSIKDNYLSEDKEISPDDKQAIGACLSSNYGVY